MIKINGLQAIYYCRSESEFAELKNKQNKVRAKRYNLVNSLILTILILT